MHPQIVEIKNKLLNFLDAMEALAMKDPFALVALKELYAGEGPERFDADIQAAAEVLASYNGFQPVKRNLYDSEPVYSGVMLCESPGRFGGGNTFEYLNEAKHSDFANMIPEDVYSWANSALNNRAYTNLLSYMVELGADEVDQAGCLSGLCFNYAELTHLLITTDFDFIPVRSLEISIDGPDGGQILLESKLDFSQNFCPYEPAEDLLEEIIALHSLGEQN